MSRKKILIAILGLSAFILAGAAGYFVPDWVKQYRVAGIMDRPFAQPEIPEVVVSAFAAQFQKMRVSTEPMRLPDDAFMGPDGKKVRFSDYHGKPVLVNFWAVWCPPCIVELPSLEKLKRFYDGELEVVAVSVDQGKTGDDIRTFLEKRRIGSFAAYLDKDGAFTRKVNIGGLPTSFLVGSDGYILYRFEGDADWVSPDSKMFFDQFLLQN